MYRLCVRILALFCFSLITASAGRGAPLPSCSEGARTATACEFLFPFQSVQLQSGKLSAYHDLLLTVEFRSPSASTIRIIGFASGGTLHVRFTPTEPGTWTYRTTSLLPALDGKESTFSVADSGLPGMVTVANLRHWRTGKRQPHLWLSAEVPWLELPQPQFESWLDDRKREGFTHVRGKLLNSRASLKAMNASGEPNDEYFSALDDRLIAVSTRGFALDLIVADAGSARSIPEDLIRHLVSRYGSFNVTWQGFEHFDERAGMREQLRTLGEQLKKFDGYAHPRSSDAKVSSSPLLNDGWMSFLIEASARAEVGAVEHQFTSQPQIHVISASEPAAFRRELWSATANGEYPTATYNALQNAENLKAIATWKNIMANTRHWEFEPYFDVSGARGVGLEEIEYLAYAPTGGIVEITVPRHKYNPQWVNPANGETIPLKDYKGETFSRPTPDNSHDWILEFPRDGKKESMAKYFFFESVDAPVQDAETESTRSPFQVVEPSGDVFTARIPVPFETKITRANRGSRYLQYLWWGEVVANGEGPRLLGVGPSGNLVLPPFLLKENSTSISLRVQAINANGKAYEIDRIYRLAP